MFFSSTRCSRFAGWLVLFMLPLSACKNEDTLSANEALQAIQRATWTAAMLQQAHQVVEPWRALNAGFNEETLLQVVSDQFGECAEVSTTDADGTRWRVDTNAHCEQESTRCAGTFELQTQNASDASNAPWVKIENYLLQCDGVAVEQGTLRFRNATLPQDERPALEIDFRDLAYNATQSDTLAAEDFDGRAYFIDDHVQANEDGATFPATLVQGEASFQDSGAQRTWAITMENLALYGQSSTPRGGALRMRTVGTNLYDFKSTWLPLTEFSTRVTIRNGRDVWVGCISHDARDLCNAPAP